MKHIWSNVIDSILGVGLSLESVGVRNWALDRASALVALQKLSGEQVAVLGGDVYVMVDGSLESNCDNWYCKRNDGESDPDFVERSIAAARTYISNYKIDEGRLLFAVVPSVALK